MKYPNEMAYAKTFMRSLSEKFSGQAKAFIIVLHINPTSLPLIETLNKKGRIAGIIAKPNSINYTTYEHLSDKYKFLKTAKEDLLVPGVAANLVMDSIRPDEKAIIIDIGGYFAGALSSLNNVSNLAGIVEDTENGLQKYERALSHLPNNNIPVFSIARSRTKDFEDYLIGRSIALSALEVLRKEKVEKWKNKNIGVIGFGEVGRGIAFYLKDRYELNVSVYDRNPELAEHIALSGFMTVSRAKILQNSDILFCATGHASLFDEDIQFIKKDCCIASCTSRDDEFGFKSFDIMNGTISPRNTSSINGIHFINCGNAVNFMRPDRLERILSPYIYLTHSALIESAAQIDTGKDLKTTEINMLDKDREQKIITDFRCGLKNPNKNSLFINRFIASKIADR